MQWHTKLDGKIVNISLRGLRTKAEKKQLQWADFWLFRLKITAKMPRIKVDILWIKSKLKSEEVEKWGVEIYQN